MSGQVVVVTGAARGLGLAAAEEFLRSGALVTIIDRDRGVEEVAAGLGPRCDALVVDIASEAECRAAVECVTQRRDQIDVLINNAAIALTNTAIRTPMSEVRTLFEVNVFGAMHMTLAALPAMVERSHGYALNVCSVAGGIPSPREAAYSATKAALIRWSEGLNVELARTGVAVGVLCPGPFKTAIGEEQADRDRPRRNLVRESGPRLAARAMVDMATRSTPYRTAPRRFGAVTALYPMLRWPMTFGLRLFERATFGDPAHDGGLLSTDVPKNTETRMDSR